MVIDELGSTCSNLKDISNNKIVVIMLLEKLTFFNEEPTYLKKYDLVRKYPNIKVRHFYQLDYGLGIDWESMDIIPRTANFSFHGKDESQSLNYSNLKSSDIYSIAIGVGARNKILFTLKGEQHDFSEPTVSLIEHIEIKVDCSD